MRIKLPMKGLVDAQAFADQPSETTADAVNVRPIDPPTGRERIAQRSGTTKYLADRVADAAVRWMGQVSYDGRRFTYSAGTGVPEWSFILPSASESQFGCKDRQGNLYILDGLANIVKVNPSGEKVWSLTPPVKDPRQKVRAVFVDQRDNVYVGVSDGGQQTLSRLWRFSQRKGEPPKQEWEVEIDGYVEKVIVRGDLVYTLENRPDRWGAQVVCRFGALTTGPTFAWATDVAYPANDFVLKADGSVVGCSPPFASRGLDPRYPAFTQRTIDARLRDILGDEYATKVWRDQDASTLAATLNTSGLRIQSGDTALRDGDPVNFWPDASGADRDLFLRVTVANNTAPLYNAKGIGGKPSVYFRGIRTLPATADALQSNFSASATQSYLDQHQGLVPGYEGATWIMFIVMRPEEDKAAAPALNAVLGQPNTIGGTNPQQSLFVNRNDTGTVVPGVGAWYDITSAAGNGTGVQTSGGNHLPNQFQYGEAGGADSQPVAGNSTGTIILTIGCDNGMNAGVDGAAYMHSFLRVNGKPIDRWETASGNKTISPGILGHTQDPTAGIGYFRGDIARVIVVHQPGGAPPNGGPITHPKYPHNIHDAITVPVGNPFVAWTPSALSTTTTQMEKIEGMLAHEYGISHLLPTSGATTATYSAVAPFKTTNNHGNYPHPFYNENGPPRQSGLNVRSEPYTMHTKNGCVWKLEGAKGDLQWVLTGTSAEDGGGLGYAVGITSGGHVYSVGPKLAPGAAQIDGSVSAAGTGDINVRLIEDKDAKGVAGYNTLTTIGNIPWQATLGTTSDDFDTNRIRVAVDEFDNLYVPINYTALTTPATLKVYRYAPDTSGGTNVGDEILSYYDANGAGAYAALTPTSPPYRYGASYDWDRNAITDARQARAEFCYLFQNQPSARDAGLVKLRIVNATPVDEPARRTVLVQVVNGEIWKFTTSGLTAPAGASTLTAPQLSATAAYIDGAVFDQKLYLTDGDKIVVFDPILDTVTTLKASDGGQVPEHCKLLANWRGRMALSRATDDPQNWHLSEMGNPRGWDRFGVPLLSTRAISGNNARAGLCPDIVNSLIPYTDNILIFLCDHSVWALVGDPANEGSSAGMRQVSAITGGSFGRPWTLSPEGVVFFFGSRGGVYAMKPGGDPVNMTLETIDRRLTEVNLDDYRVEMAWNSDDDGLHLFFIGDEDTTHYFWQRGTNSWWSDTFAFLPTSILIADGDDAEDRVLLIGCADGYVRVWDRAAKSDDGEPIPTRLLVGPMAPEAAEFETRFTDLEAVLARDQDPVQVSVYVSDQPDDKGARRASVEMQPGRNLPKPVRAAGSYVWFLIEQANASRRWAIESMGIRANRGGRKRVTR